ncbi:MAG: DUF2029 domain-containing protein [Gemmatimonadaceae bacterium]|nr:DUF2029 domain-containing protein [Gemmatimonadaceae bacterium]
MHATASQPPPARALDRVAAVPAWRWRRILLGLYLLLAFADAAGKALAASSGVGPLVTRLLHPAAAVRVTTARTPRGNFEIFRAASHHLVEGQDLYARYPDALQDQFKYSPTFALLFAPFAWLPWPLALFLWNALNALVLFVAVERVLAPRPAALALGLLLPEVLRSMQNAQSNALVAGLIILTYAAIERGRTWRAAFAVAVGACVKIFPLAALPFAIPRRRTLRTGFATIAAGILLLLLPLLVTPPATLLAQYRSWHAIETLDTTQRWFSVMQLAHRITGADLPNWPLQLAGTLALLAPLAVRRDRWDDARFRLQFLCSVLLYVTLFNHQAERASFVIAFTGITIWFVSEPRAGWRTTLFGVALVTIPLMSTLIPLPAALRTPGVVLLRLAVPALLVWIAIQRELWRRPSGSLG